VVKSKSKTKRKQTHVWIRSSPKHFLIGKLKSDTTSTTKHVPQTTTTTTTTTTAFTYVNATVGAGQAAFGTAKLKVMAVQEWGFTFVGGGRHSEKNEKNGKERKRTERTKRTENKCEVFVKNYFLTAFVKFDLNVKKNNNCQ
jgi:hypothetical protein